MHTNKDRSGLVFVLAAVLLLVFISYKGNLSNQRTGNLPIAAAASSSNTSAETTDPNAPEWTHPRSDERADERTALVRVLKLRYEMTDPNVLRAMGDVPRHWFMPKRVQRAAYIDGPQPIGHGQTISQPFIVAYMTQLLELSAESKVLEIGTGSGYQAAVLSEFTPHVYTIEIVEELGCLAIATFKQRGYNTIRAKIGDGYKGWPEYAPFDAVIVTCAPDHIPKPLIEQLKPGGVIVIPVGSRWGVQDLLLVTKRANGTLRRESKMPVRFVPLTREKD